MNYNKNDISTEEIKKCTEKLKTKLPYLIVPVIILFIFPPLFFLLVFIIFFKQDILKNYFESAWMLECLKKITLVKQNIKMKWFEKVFNNNSYWKQGKSNTLINSTTVKKELYIKDGVNYSKTYTTNSWNNSDLKNNSDFWKSNNHRKFNTSLKTNNYSSKKRVVKKDSKKEGKYTFNGWKSVWDDYESVLDK